MPPFEVARVNPGRAGPIHPALKYNAPLHQKFGLTLAQTGPLNLEALKIQKLYDQVKGNFPNAETFLEWALLDAEALGKPFCVVEANPRSFTAFNNYSHDVGDQVIELKREVFKEYLDTSGLEYHSFGAKINDIYIVFGNPDQVKSVVSQAQKACSAAPVIIDIHPEQIEDAKLRKQFISEFVLANDLEPDSAGRYRVNINKNAKLATKDNVPLNAAPLMKKDGIAVDGLELNASLMHVDPSNPKVLTGGAGALTRAAWVMLEQLNNLNPGKAKVLYYDAARDFKLEPDPADLSRWEITVQPEAAEAYVALLKEEALLLSALDSRDAFRENLFQTVKDKLPQELKLQKIELKPAGGQEARPQLRGNTLIIPLLNQFGRVTAEVELTAAKPGTFTQSMAEELFPREFRLRLGMVETVNQELFVDPHYHIGNRKNLLEKMDQLHKEGKPYWLVFFDFDKFKSFKDTFDDGANLHGTKMGDVVFRKMLDIYCEVMKEHGLLDSGVDRYGGEELCHVFSRFLARLSPKSLSRIFAEMNDRFAGAKDLFYSFYLDEAGLMGKKAIADMLRDPELSKYVAAVEKAGSENERPRQLITVDLTRVLRWSNKYQTYTHGLRMSIGAVLVDSIETTVRQALKDADGLAGRAKSGGDDKFVKVVFDTRKLTRSEEDSPRKN